jgi:hypothetical protein
LCGNRDSDQNDDEDNDSNRQSAQLFDGQTPTNDRAGDACLNSLSDEPDGEKGGLAVETEASASVPPP